MRTRLMCIIGCVIGTLMIALPYAFSVIATAPLLDTSGVSIIGGADGPTAVMIAHEVTRDYFWIILPGAAVVIASTIALLRKR